MINTEQKLIILMVHAFYVQKKASHLLSPHNQSAGGVHWEEIHTDWGTVEEQNRLWAHSVPQAPQKHTFVKEKFSYDELNANPNNR